MVTQQVTAGFFQAPSQSKPALMTMDGDKPHWLPIHSLMLMFDQHFSQCLPTVMPTRGMKYILSSLELVRLCEAVPRLLLVSFYVYLVVFLNTFRYMLNTDKCTFVIFK